MRRAAATALEAILEKAVAVLKDGSHDDKAVPECAAVAAAQVRTFVATWETPKILQATGADAVIREFGTRLAALSSLLLP